MLFVALPLTGIAAGYTMGKYGFDAFTHLRATIGDGGQGEGKRGWTTRLRREVGIPREKMKMGGWKGQKTR